MDTRFWGPSGWQMFHLIAFKSPPSSVHDVLDDLHLVLPCKFCRESTSEFVRKHPVHTPYSKWLYHIHNMVNNKLRSQAAADPKVINPGPDPSYEEIKQRYEAIQTPDAVPGRDFLMSIAYNYPADPEEREMSMQREFLHHLSEAYPFDPLRKIFQTYIRENEPTLQSQKAYTL